MPYTVVIITFRNMAEEVILSTIETIDICLLNMTEYRKKAVEGVKNEFMLILDFLKDSVCSRNKLVNYLIADVVELAHNVREIVSIEYEYLDWVEDRLKKLKERMLHVGGEAGQGASIPYPVALSDHRMWWGWRKPLSLCFSKRSSPGKIGSSHKALTCVLSRVWVASERQLWQKNYTIMLTW